MKDRITIAELTAIIVLIVSIGGVVSAHFLGIAEAKKSTDEKLQEYVRKDVYLELKQFIEKKFDHIDSQLKDIRTDLKGAFDEQELGRFKSSIQTQSN